MYYVYVCINADTIYPSQLTEDIFSSLQVHYFVHPITKWLDVQIIIYPSMHSRLVLSQTTRVEKKHE